MVSPELSRRGVRDRCATVLGVYVMMLAGKYMGFNEPEGASGSPGLRSVSTPLQDRAVAASHDQEKEPPLAKAVVKADFFARVT